VHAVLGQRLHQLLGQAEVGERHGVGVGERRVVGDLGAGDHIGVEPIGLDDIDVEHIYIEHINIEHIDIHDVEQIDIGEVFNTLINEFGPGYRKPSRGADTSSGAYERMACAAADTQNGH
jgi:hypothetical protein